MSDLAAGKNPLSTAGPSEIRAFLSSRKRVEINDETLTRAAVLMLLYPRNGILHVLLTKRTSDVEHHKGQISFPGGSVDSEDRDIIGTALRETEEEVGIPSAGIEVLGLFNDAWTPSGFRITPVIAYLSKAPSLRPNAGEVEEILEVPVSLFLDKAAERRKTVVREGKSFEIYFFDHGTHEIWGATAGMLRSFLRGLQDFLASSKRL